MYVRLPRGSLLFLFDLRQMSPQKKPSLKSNIAWRAWESARERWEPKLEKSQDTEVSCSSAKGAASPGSSEFAMSKGKQSGTVKNFNSKRGFGFITPVPLSCASSRSKIYCKTHVSSNVFLFSNSNSICYSEKSRNLVFVRNSGSMARVQQNS